MRFSLPIGISVGTLVGALAGLIATPGENRNENFALRLDRLEQTLERLRTRPESEEVTAPTHVDTHASESQRLAELRRRLDAIDARWTELAPLAAVTASDLPGEPAAVHEEAIQPGITIEEIEVVLLEYADMHPQDLREWGENLPGNFVTDAFAVASDDALFPDLQAGVAKLLATWQTRLDLAEESCRKRQRILTPDEIHTVFRGFVQASLEWAGRQGVALRSDWRRSLPSLHATWSPDRP